MASTPSTSLNVEETPTIQPPKGAAKSKKTTLADLKGQDLAQRKFARKLITPALVVAILITQIPFLATIYYSFQDWNLARPQERPRSGRSNFSPGLLVLRAAE